MAAIIVHHQIHPIFASSTPKVHEIFAFILTLLKSTFHEVSNKLMKPLYEPNDKHAKGARLLEISNYRA
jgi:hypothetical protein